MEQPKLFEQTTQSETLENVLLYALGDFQSRGKVLANRELALDRLHGAFARSFEKFGMTKPSDEELAQGLRILGADVVEIPNYVAKRPFRVTVSKEVGDRALEWFRDRQLSDVR